MTSTGSIDFGVVLTQMGGGLALFLYGMRQMTEALKTVAGSGMKKLLARLTVNRFAAAAAGALVTSVVQSSSVTTVLVVGFVSAGLLNLGQSIGVILGANVGTTITGQVIAFQVYKYGLVMIAAGFFTEILARRERVRQWGVVVMGLGLIFFGMELMSIATGPLRQWQPFIDLMQNMQNPFLAVMVGAAFTAIVQSSSATTGIVIVLATQGVISLESGIGLLFGANIGTCVTAYISAYGRPREALQVAFAHVLFNVCGVLLWIFLVPQFAELVRAISPTSKGLSEAARLAVDTPRQIANAHTLFNVANMLLFIWFTGPLARLVQRIVPPRPEVPGIAAKYLDELYLEQPALALDQVRRELLRLGEIIRVMLEKSFSMVSTGGGNDFAEMSRADSKVDDLYDAIILYLGQLSQKDMIQPQPQVLSQFVGIANYLENMGDVIEKDFQAASMKRVGAGLTLSAATLAKLRPIHKEVCQAFDKALATLETQDVNTCSEVVASKKDVTRLADEATARIAERLIADEPNRLEAFQIETDIIEGYRRLHAYARRVAKLSIENQSGVVEPNA